MKWLMVVVLGLVLAGCDKPKADLLGTGLLVGANCPGTVYLRGSVALKTDCIVVLSNPNGPSSFPVDKSYEEYIGRNVAVVSVKESVNVVTPTQ